MTEPVWTGAELRARLGFLGFTLDSYAKYSGRSERMLRRYALEQAKMPLTLTSEVEALEVLAERQLTVWADSAGPVRIPRLTLVQEPGQFPAHWFLALAGRYLARFGRVGSIVWDE